MLVGVSGNPPFLIPALWNIGILLHKQATRTKHLDGKCNVIYKFLVILWVCNLEIISISITFRRCLDGNFSKQMTQINLEILSWLFRTCSRKEFLCLYVFSHLSQPKGLSKSWVFWWITKLDFNAKLLPQCSHAKAFPSSECCFLKCLSIWNVGNFINFQMYTLERSYCFQLFRRGLL